MLYGVFFVFILALLFIQFFIKDHLSKWIILSFVGYWFLALLFSIYNPYGLYEVSSYAYFLLILNVMSFLIGFSCIHISPLQVSCLVTENVSVLSTMQKIINSKFFLGIVLLGILVCTNIYRQYASLLFLLDSRVDAISLIAKENQGNIFFQIYSFLCPPLFYSLCAISAYMILCYRRWGKIFLFLLFLVLYSLIGGGRASFLVFFMALLFCYFICRDIFHVAKIKVSKFAYLLIVILILLAYIMMSWITAMRSGYFTFNMEAIIHGSEELNKQFITYSLLPFRLFDYALSNQYLDKIGYQYGLSTFDGLNRYAWIILKKFGITISLVSENTTDFFQDSWISVGEDTVANYAYTNAIYHYLDFGVLGIFIFPFLFGIFFRLLIKRFCKSFSVPLYCLLFYLFFVLMHMIFTWHIQKMYALAFIGIMTFYSFKKRKIVMKYSLK